MSTQTDREPPDISVSNRETPDTNTSHQPPETSKAAEKNLFNESTRVILRETWGAQDPKWITMLTTPVKKVVLTWTETDPCFTEEECKQTVKNIQTAHLAIEDVPDIKHNFLLGGDGSLYEGRGFVREGPYYPQAEKKGHKLNGESIEIAFIERCSNKPSPMLLKVLSECLSFGIAGNYIEKTFQMYWMAEKEVIYIQPTETEPQQTTETTAANNRMTSQLLK